MKSVRKSVASTSHDDIKSWRYLKIMMMITTKLSTNMKSKQIKKY